MEDDSNSGPLQALVRRVSVLPRNVIFSRFTEISQPGSLTYAVAKEAIQRGAIQGASGDRTRVSLRFLVSAASHLLTDINAFLSWLAISDA